MGGKSLHKVRTRNAAEQLCSCCSSHRTKSFSDDIFRHVSPKLNFSQHPRFLLTYSILCVEWLLGNFAVSPLYKTGQSNFRPPTRHKHWARQEYQWWSRDTKKQQPETENTADQCFQLFSVPTLLALSAQPPLNCGHACQPRLSSARRRVFEVDLQAVQQL